MTAFSIRQDDLNNPRVRDLIALHLAGMHASSPNDSVYALDLSSLREKYVTIWSAWQNDQVAAIGAL